MRRAVTAEFLGALLLTAAVVGSGIMGERLAGGNAAIALLANTGATVAALATLISLLGPISGAHFNPVVTLVAVWRGDMPSAQATSYILAQIAGCCAGAVLANAMFELPLIETSTHVRTGFSQWLSEGVATAGLVLRRFQLAHDRRRGLARFRLDWLGLLVHGLDVVREPGDHAGPLADQQLCRHPSRRRAGIHRGTARRRRHRRAAVAPARRSQGDRMTEALALAERLNRECECVGTDVPALQQRLDAELGVETHPHLFCGPARIPGEAARE